MSNLNQDEKDLLKSFENDEWLSVGNPTRLENIKECAMATSIKEKEVTLMLSSLDLEMIETKAIQEGITYQSLMSSILHKYITGKLVDV